jgi:hypothetical protein
MNSNYQEKQPIDRKMLAEILKKSLRILGLLFFGSIVFYLFSKKETP